MKKINYNFIYIILILAFIFIIYRNPDLRIGENYRNRMYYDLKNYAEEIKGFNEKLSGALIIEDYDYFDKELYISNEILINFRKSKTNAGKVRKFDYFNDYDDVYRRANDNISSIMRDGTVSSSEKEYINTLYDYNERIADEYKNILESLSDSSKKDIDENKAIKKITKIYNIFSNKAEEILNMEDYSMLKKYKGDFTNFDYDKAEKFVDDLFSKVVPGRVLDYNNKDDIYDDKFIFTTYEDEIKTGMVYQVPPYRIEYDKVSGEVSLRLAGRTIHGNTFKEEEIDSMVQDILARLGYEGVLCERTVSNFDLPDLSSITYSYINKVDDVWDQQQKIKLVMDAYGLVNEFYIMDGDDTENLHFIDSQEILNKIHKEADVNDIYKVKNIDGKAEYIAKMTYKGINYELIFDGTDGSLIKTIEAD